MQTKSSSSRHILAYDADCGPCTRFAHVVDLLDRRQKIHFISLNMADQQGLLDRISAPLRYKSFHLILPNGDTKSGSVALAELIAILPAGKILSIIINYCPGARRIVEFIYNRFSRLHDRGSCRISSDNSDDNNNKSDEY